MYTHARTHTYSLISGKWLEHASVTRAMDLHVLYSPENKPLPLSAVDMAQAGEGAYFWICTMHREILSPRPLTDIALLAFSVYVHLRNLPSCINRVCCHLEPEQNQALLSCGQLHVHECSQADSWGHRCHQWTLWACFYALVNRKSWQVRKNHPDYEKERTYWSLLIQYLLTVPSL